MTADGPLGCDVDPELSGCHTLARDSGSVPSSPLRRAALIAAALAGPVGFVTRAAWGLPTALGAGPRTLRPTVAGRRSSPTGGSTTACPRRPCRRRAPARACCGRCTRSGTSAARRADPARPGRESRRPPSWRSTWFGHASALLEVDGQRVLVDPVWSHRVSPSPVFGPTRLHEVPVAAGRAAAGRRRPHLARPLRPPRPAHGPGPAEHAVRAVRRPARDRGAPARLGCAGGPHRGAGLGRQHDRRRPDAHLHRGAALLRPLLRPGHHALGLLGGRRPAAPRVLRRGHRLPRPPSPSSARGWAPST